MSKENIYFPEIPDFLVKRVKSEFGHIISSIQEPVYVSLSKDSNIKALVHADKGKEIHIGDYLLVYDYLRGELISTRIIAHSTQTIDENRTTDQLYRLEAESGYEQFSEKRYDFLRSPHIVHLDPISIIRTVGGRIYSAGSVDFAPSEFAAVFVPKDDELGTIIGLKDEGMSIGILARESEVHLFRRFETKQDYVKPIRLSREVLNRHCTINGSTGSGKTVAIKCLIKEIMKDEGTVLLTDTQGDFVSQLYRTELAENQKEYCCKNREEIRLFEEAMNINYSEIGIAKEKLQVFYPPLMEKDEIIQDLEKKKIQVRPLQLSSKLITNWSILATIIPNLNDTQYQALELLFNDFLNKETEAGRSFDLEGFLHWLDSESGESRITSDFKIHKSTLGVIQRNLHVLLQKNFLDRAKDTTTTYKDLIQSGKITILYLPSDNLEVLSVRPLIQLMIYGMIQKNKKQSNFQRVIIIDEAQEIIPNEAEATSKSVARELAKQFQLLAQQGRKYNLSLIVASQEPRKINKTVFSQCATRIFLRLTSEEIQKLSHEIPEECRKPLVRLRRGSALLISPDEIEIGHVWLKFPLPTIYHEKPTKTVEIIRKELGHQKVEKKIEPSRSVSLKDKLEESR